MKQTDKQLQQHSKVWRKLIGSLLRWWWVWAVAIVAVAVAYIYKGVTDNPPVKLRVEHNTRIDVTPEQIMSVRDVGQWEFLTINTEEVVEWERKRTFGTDRLVRIYQGTLRLGVDMQKAPTNWFASLPDSTAQLTLPPVKLLDDHFIDEARTRSFYESGTVPPDVLDQLYAQAQQKMRSRCLTPQNLQAAESNARRQFERIFRQMGFKRVVIKFQDKA